MFKSHKFVFDCFLCTTVLEIRSKLKTVVFLKISMLQIVSLAQKAFIQLSYLNRGSHPFEKP